MLTEEEERSMADTWRQMGRLTEETRGRHWCRSPCRGALPKSQPSKSWPMPFD